MLLKYALSVNLRAPRRPTSSAAVPQSQNGRASLRARTRSAAAILQSASSFTSATPRPKRTPSLSVSARGSPCVSLQRDTGPGGTVSVCVTRSSPPRALAGTSPRESRSRESAEAQGAPASSPPGPARRLACSASGAPSIDSRHSNRRTGRPARA